MTITLTAGWWLVPLAVTLLSFAWALWPEKNPTYGSAVVGVFHAGAASVVSLASWLIWSLTK